MNTADIRTIKWTHLEKVLNEFADYFIQEARNNLGANRSYATGTLGDTMRKIVEIDGNHYSVSIELADYWIYVEKGRKKGKFPPPHRIKEWIMVKPVKPAVRNGKLPTVDQLAYLIGRKIATEGTKPAPFFKPAKDDALQRYKLAIDLAIDEDISEWVIEKVIQQDFYDELFKML